MSQIDAELIDGIKTGDVNKVTNAVNRLSDEKLRIEDKDGNALSHAIKGLLLVSEKLRAHRGGGGITSKKDYELLSKRLKICKLLNDCGLWIDESGSGAGGNALNLRLKEYLNHDRLADGLWVEEKDFLDKLFLAPEVPQ